MDDPCTQTAPLDLVTLEQFRRDGFIKLKSLLEPEWIAAVRADAHGKVQSSAARGSKFGTDFSRLSYDLGDAPSVAQVYNSTRFSALVADLFGARFTFTEAVALELAPGGEGFRWHHDSVAFGFIREKDAAFSLWIPLDEIDTADQHGGIACVPEHLSSARPAYDLAGTLAHAGRDFHGLSAEQRHEIRQSYLQQREMFEQHKVEHDFAVGDALVFSKFTWHKSCPLRVGRKQTRLACSLRFADWTSRLDLRRAEWEYATGGGGALGKDVGKAPTTYGYSFTDIEDGAPLRKSTRWGPLLGAPPGSD